jgi:acyl-CoA dehydrogenase
MFINVVYAQLILENARIYATPPALVDRIFDVLVRDVAHQAVTLHAKPSTTAEQQRYCLKMVQRPVANSDEPGLYEEHVLALSGAYAMPA